MCFRLLGGLCFLWLLVIFSRDITMGLPWIHTWQMLSSRNRDLHWNELVVAVCDDVGKNAIDKMPDTSQVRSFLFGIVFGDSCPHHIPWPCLWIYNVYDMDPYTYCIYIYIWSLLLEAISLWRIWVVRPRGSHIVPHLAEEWWISLRAPSQWILIWLTHKSPGEVRHFSIFFHIFPYFSIFFRYPSPASHQQKVQDPSFFPGSIWLAAGSFPDGHEMDLGPWDGTQNLRLRRVTPRGLDMSGGQNYFLPAMDMAKVGAPLPLVKVCTSMLCTKIGYR